MYCFSFLPASLYLPLLISALGIPLSRNSGCAFICPPEDREANPWDNRTGQVNLKSNFQCFYQTERARYGCRYSSLDGSYKAGLDTALCPRKAVQACQDQRKAMDYDSVVTLHTYYISE
ncbi:hypothetical protein WG66_006969 [Moniliophthora roreri]|nr:hypothetical protein WG66_006969 [Moniliophthora roreri]